jgi:hypothetical protein
MPTSCRLAHHDTVLPCSNRSKLATATPELVERYRCTTPGGYDARGKASRVPDDNAKSRRKASSPGRSSGRKQVRCPNWILREGRRGGLAHYRSRGRSGPLIDAKPPPECGGKPRPIVSPWVHRRWAPGSSRRAGPMGPRNRDAPQSKGWAPVSGEPPCGVAGTVARVGTRRRRSPVHPDPAAGAPARAHQLRRPRMLFASILPPPQRGLASRTPPVPGLAFRSPPRCAPCVPPASSCFVAAPHRAGSTSLRACMPP